MNVWLASRLVAVAAATTLVLTGCTGSGGSTDASASPSGGPGVTSPSPDVSTSDATTAPPTGASPTASASAPGRGESVPGFRGLLPMWPFATLAQAEDWEGEFRSGGHQPWHLDAEQTALSFTRHYLGFEGLDRVTSRSVDGRQARIGVGLSGTESTGTAAVVHLVRFGAGPDAPWEVVGTDDTTFSLTTPAYGATVSSPLKVGGRITGVDESVRVEVRQPSATAPLGTSCCTSAGGKGQPWRSSVSFAGGGGAVLTIVASTGGHLAEVERFTVTAVRTR